MERKFNPIGQLIEWLNRLESVEMDKGNDIDHQAVQNIYDTRDHLAKYNRLVMLHTAEYDTRCKLQTELQAAKQRIHDLEIEALKSKERLSLYNLGFRDSDV